MKCYEITPHPNTSYDSAIIVAGGSWAPALELVESALESQFLDDKEWPDITVTIRCVELSQDGLDELGE